MSEEQKIQGMDQQDTFAQFESHKPGDDKYLDQKDFDTIVSETTALRAKQLAHVHPHSLSDVLEEDCEVLELPKAPDSKILFVVASLWEFNTPTASTVDGLPYLHYIPGEVFDVLGEKGELWLAVNQDDDKQETGWIWGKHFVKLDMGKEDSIVTQVSSQEPPTKLTVGPEEHFERHEPDQISNFVRPDSESSSSTDSDDDDPPERIKASIPVWSPLQKLAFELDKITKERRARIKDLVPRSQESNANDFEGQVMKMQHQEHCRRLLLKALHYRLRYHQFLHWGLA